MGWWRPSYVCTRLNANLSPDPAALWLCQLPGMTSKLALQLVAESGSPEAVLRMSASKLREHGVAPGLIAKIVAGPRQIPQVAAGLKGWQRLGIVPVPLVSAAYPQRLHALPEPPLVLYLQGQWPIQPPLCLAVAGESHAPRIAEIWPPIVAALAPHVRFAMIEPDVILPTAIPRLIGLPYGLALARQRVPVEAWKAVADGQTTLLSISAPTMQPDSHTRAIVQAALAALADALIALMPVAPNLAPLIETAQRVGAAAFAFGAAPHEAVPASLRRLRPGASGVRTLLKALGVQQAGAETVQQERLF